MFFVLQNSKGEFLDKMGQETTRLQDAAQYKFYIPTDGRHVALEITPVLPKELPHHTIMNWQPVPFEYRLL